MYSHHQKSIIMDVKGELVAYVGGLDVTKGTFFEPCSPNSDPLVRCNALMISMEVGHALHLAMFVTSSNLQRLQSLECFFFSLHMYYTYTAQANTTVRKLLLSFEKLSDDGLK